MIRARVLLSLLPLMLFAGAPATATAQTSLNLGLLVICTELKDDAQRLQCFDKLVASALKAPAPQAQKNAVTTDDHDWKITESRSPVDDAVQMAAVLEAADGHGALVMRCHDRISDAYLNLRTYVGGVEPLRIVYRINRESAVETRWSPSKSGDSVFVPQQAFFPFIRALPEDGDLFVRVTDFQGRTLDLNFKLGPVAEVRDMLGSKCRWPSEQRPPEQRTADQKPSPAGATAPPPQRRQPSKKIVSVPQSAQGWNVTSQRR
jgi:hypothetical protein